MQNIPSTISITTPTTELVVQFAILQLKFVFTRVLEFALCFAVKYWWVLHQSYITACFCMLLLVLSYIRRHYMTRSFDGISLNLALRFIFLLQILFACPLCFIPFLYNYRLYFKLVVLLNYCSLCDDVSPLFIVFRYFVNSSFPLLGRFRIHVNSITLLLVRTFASTPALFYKGYFKDDSS